jgi:hypothetical protein
VSWGTTATYGWAKSDHSRKDGNIEAWRKSWKSIYEKSGKTPNGVLALSEKSIEEAAKQLGTIKRSFHLKGSFIISRFVLLRLRIHPGTYLRPFAGHHPMNPLER